MSGARVRRLVRYPIKGCAGEDIDSASLFPGRGLPGDRVLAIANGHRPVPHAGHWAPTETFARLTTDTGLLRLGVGFDDATATVTLHHPGRAPVTVSLDQPESREDADALLRQWLPAGPHGGPELVRADRGYWDDRTGAVSLINLDTVDALAEAIEAPVDPLRFRGNLYVSGLGAWAELSLPGERIRLGEAELDVLHPINRCGATCVNPLTSEADLNIPAALMTRFGHLYCGVRARVITPGTVRTGDRLIRTRHRGSPRPPTAGLPPEHWPRPARIVAREAECDDVVSIWVRDPLQQLRAPHRAGQHLRIHITDDRGPLWRCYTISGAHHGDLRISVKRHPDGRMSRWLHRHARVDATLLVSGPHGTLTADSDSCPAPESGSRPPLLLAGAGIGITQTLALLHAAAEEDPGRPIVLCHTARSGRRLALWEEARTAIANLPQGHAQLFLTHPERGDLTRWNATAGHPDIGDVAAPLVDLPTATAYLCGPSGFMDAARTSLIRRGLPAGAVHQETFASPGASSQAFVPPPSGPFRVSFTVSDRHADWTPDHGTLLDLADTLGIPAPSGCRVGACHLCQQPVGSGSITHTTPPALPPNPGNALLCCAVPTSDLRIPL
ncbi:MOSC domain-containing protein [Streptomyces sp. 8N706]|uniref:MOSC domain-containing protein n=1 Tax=Streptomyces sp. 8N706 TaxID=3457416 RepID=UPI003FD3FB2E